MDNKKIVGILPNNYVHVLDLNTNVTSLEVGPRNLMLQDNHKLVSGPLPFIKIKPGHYCTVNNPIDKSKPLQEGKLFDLKFGHKEVRLHGEPFPLFPGETLENATPDKYDNAIKPLPTVKALHALHLKALVDIKDDGFGSPRKVGEEWQLNGPITYIPSPDVELVGTINPEIVTPNHALRLRARQEMTDKDGVPRCTGEEWLVRDIGAYVLGVYEELVDRVEAYTLSSKVALYIQAKENYTDQFGIKRHIGDEWLITEKDTEAYIPDVTEDMMKVFDLTVLKRNQYCVVLDPAGSDGKSRLGVKERRVGPATFFLQPGERLEKGIKNKILLQSDEAVVITAEEEFDDTLPDGKVVHRTPGDKWMITGPAEYTPRIEIGKTELRKSIPLNENEGIYVRDVKSGKVLSIKGPQSYMLKADEDLYSKELEPLVDDLLKNGGGIGDPKIRKMSYFESSIDPKYKNRDKTRVVTYRCPNNTAVQVNNYQHKTARVVFGPDLVVLGPHESFNVLFLSAGKPKVAGALVTICLMLGPDFISDTIVVETSDHARLKVSIAMNNVFRYKDGDTDSAKKLFSVPDFIGFASREIASRIRGAVASIPFEQFHKYSTDIIRAGVFGKDKDGEFRKELVFKSNNLVITNIDVQSIEPVDHHMRDSLMKSVQMAIEISTNSIERSAQHEAKRMEQKARGELDRQKLENEKESEAARKVLLELQAVAAAVESSGQSKAEAHAHAEKLLIEGRSAIELAELRAKAALIQSETELDCEIQAREAEIAFLREQNDLELQKSKALTGVEINKLTEIVDSLGRKTLSKIAKAGPKAKIEMLKSLGLQSVLFTDGNSPINLFQSSQDTKTVQAMMAAKTT